MSLYTIAKQFASGRAVGKMEATAGDNSAHLQSSEV